MSIQDHAQRAGDADDLASSQFRAFVAVLVQARNAALALGEAEGRAGAAALSHELCQLIEVHSLEAGRLGGKGAVETHLQARFLKAALADEMFLCADWAGRAHWHHVLVEATLFQSAHAGLQVFVEIDQLLRERDPAKRTLARLYLHLLAVGFQGRYRGAASLGPIAEYRRELFQFAYQRLPDLDARDGVLSEQPYASTLAAGTGQRLAKPSRRSALLAVSLLVLLGLSEALWLWQSRPVREVLRPPAASPVQQVNA